MQWGDRRFAPRVWAIVLYVAVLSCMLSLGHWQMERAALKVSMQSAAEAAGNSEATALLGVTDLTAAAASYQRTQVTGTYDPVRQFLWDNRTYKGRAGYEVISLIRLENNVLALVNRGWVAPGANRQELPDVALPDAVFNKTVTIEGYLSQPSKGFASGEAVTDDDGWPKRIQFFDYEALASVLGEPIVPAVVQAQALGTDSVTPLVLTSRPEWLEANWQPAATGPAKHYSYAFQWFAMALALTGIFLVVNTQRIQTEPESDEVTVSDRSKVTSNE